MNFWSKFVVKSFQVVMICLFQMTISVRDDLGSGAPLFSRKHPLSCWLSSMLMCFAGSLTANFLLGEPVISPFKRQENVILVMIINYARFIQGVNSVYALSKQNFLGSLLKWTEGWSSFRLFKIHSSFVSYGQWSLVFTTFLFCLWWTGFELLLA